MVSGLESFSECVEGPWVSFRISLGLCILFPLPVVPDPSSNVPLLRTFPAAGRTRPLAGFYNAHPFLCSSGHGEKFTAVPCPHSTGTVLRMGEVRHSGPQSMAGPALYQGPELQRPGKGEACGEPLISIPWAAGEGCRAEIQKSCVSALILLQLCFVTLD